MPKALKGQTLVTLLLALAVWGAIHAFFWLLPGVGDLLQARITDALFGLRHRLTAFRPAYDDTIIHVAIDDLSLEEIGTAYLGRTETAQLVRNLGRAGVLQLHDAIFVAPQSPEEDLELIEATREAGGVYYGVALGLSADGNIAAVAPSPDDQRLLERQHWQLDVDHRGLLSSTRRTVTFPALADAARGLGFLDITADPDGVYRRAPLVARDGEGLFPGMPLRVLCDRLGVPPERIELRPGSITLRGARRPGAAGPEDIRIPVDDRGRMTVNYLGPWGSMKHYGFSTIYYASDDRFTMADLRDEIEGKIAVVSWVRTGAGDVGPVPVDPLYPLSGIHANVMHTILTGQFLRELSPLVSLLAIEVPLLILIVLLALRFGAIGHIAMMLGLFVAYVGIGVLAFLQAGLILEFPAPVALLVFTTGVLSTHRLHHESKRRAVLHNTFEAFFPPAIVRKVTADPGRLLSTAHKAELSILFSDIVGFTAHTAEMDPNHVRRLLNEYFEQMIEIVFEHEGTLDKFIGDGLMVFFGDPQHQPDHAARAVRAAVDMQRATGRLATEWARRGDMPLEIRVGINSGEVVVGNMGSSRRVSYTVLGEAVNLAQRLESSAPAGGVLISARTHELAGGVDGARHRDPVRVKGFDRPIDVFEIEPGQIETAAPR